VPDVAPAISLARASEEHGIPVQLLPKNFVFLCFDMFLLGAYLAGRANGLIKPIAEI
jgi:hypothetical protein